MKNAKGHWYHWLKLELVARTGIEPVFRFQSLNNRIHLQYL